MAITRDSAKKLFQLANEKIKDFGENVLPPGQYDVVLDVSKMIKTTAKKDMIVQEYLVVDGELTGKRHATFTDIEHEVGLSILFGQWRKLGFDTNAIGSMEDLAEHCTAITNAKYRMMIRVSLNAKNPQFTNLAITGLIETGEAAQPDVEAAESPAAEEVPDEAVQLEVGSKITYSIDGKMKKGTIVAVIDENTVKVSDALTKKASEVAISDIVEVG